jgi:hypothetical protein
MSNAAESFDPASFAPTARSEKEFLKQYVPQDDDEGVSAYFYKKDVFQPFESKQQKKDIFKPVDYVCIRVLGNDKMEHHAPARDDDKRRFPYVWQQYESGKSQAIKGLPLEELGIPGGMVNTYYAKNVFTCEDLARVSDGNLQMLPAGTRELRHKARNLIDIRGKKGEQDERIEAQQKQIAELSVQLTRALAALEAKAADPAKKSAKAAE